MAPDRIDLVDEDVDLGEGLRARITRPRAPEALLDEALAEGASDAPYWAELWPAARALAAHVVRLELAGVAAVELGCGLGLVSAAAAMAGARVLAVDNDPEAVRIARINGARAEGDVRGLVADLLDPPAALLDAGPFDLVLVADMLYEGPLADAIARLLPVLTAPQGRVLVAFPWPRQADRLASELRVAGMQVTLDELRGTGRAIGLLEARHAVPAASKRMPRPVE